MIYITGDTHSEFDRFKKRVFTEQEEMTKDDYVIICGDFGGVWTEENSRYINEENFWLDWLEERPFTTLFIDGNHENFDRLYSFPEKEWHGGRVHEIRPSVLHLIRGEIFCIDERKIFAFGGAASHDIKDGILERDEKGEWKKTKKKWTSLGKSFRIKGLSWWEQEMPCDEEMQRGIENLKKHNNEVDFIITHSPPASVIDEINDDWYSQDALSEYLENIRLNTKYKYWFSGHMHRDEKVTDKEYLLFEQLIRIR